MSGISPTNYRFSTEKIQLPAKKYLVIDPCYVIGGDPFWGDLCDFSFPDDQEHRNHFYIHSEGCVIFAFSTAYGDGFYPVSDGNICKKVGVDAGMLSLIPMDYINNHCHVEDRYGNKIIELGVEVELDSPDYPKYDNGDVFVGNITIKTNDWGKDETDYEDDEDEMPLW